MRDALHGQSDITRENSDSPQCLVSCVRQSRLNFSSRWLAVVLHSLDDDATPGFMLRGMRDWGSLFIFWNLLHQV